MLKYASLPHHKITKCVLSKQRTSSWASCGLIKSRRKRRRGGCWGSVGTPPSEGTWREHSVPTAAADQTKRLMLADVKEASRELF